MEGVRERLVSLVDALYREVPAGVGAEGKVKLSHGQERQVMVQGSRWVIEQGCGEPQDALYTEAEGCLEGANPDQVSLKAMERGKNQLGTLGSGNHFVEVQYVEEVYDEQTALALGLHLGQVTAMIHSGSRGFGHQVCTDYLTTMEKAMARYQINLPDRQLACAPVHSPEGQAYLGAMRAATNYAFANRQYLTHWVRQAFSRALGMSLTELGLSVVYDVAHNIVKFEEHRVDHRLRRLAVHRKGATRAFPPHHPETPVAYQAVGQPVLIPGDMGRYSYVLVGTEQAMAETFGSTCHGAGRLLSRRAATKAARGRSIAAELRERGIVARATSREGLTEEMSEAYKDVAEVVQVVHGAGISRRVARLRPLGVVKG